MLFKTCLSTIHFISKIKYYTIDNTEGGAGGGAEKYNCHVLSDPDPIKLRESSFANISFLSFLIPFLLWRRKKQLTTQSKV